MSDFFATGGGGTLGAGSVTYSNIQNEAATTLLGNPSGVPAAPSEIGLTGGLGFSGLNITINGAISPTSISASGNITLSKADPLLTISATSGVGAQQLLTTPTATMQFYNDGTNGYVSADTLVIRDYTTRTSIRATFNSAGINLGSGMGLSFNGTAILNSSGVLQAAGHPALTGDVTTVAGALATTIAANAVTFAKFQQVAASSLVGNATGSLANVTGITLGATLAFSASALQTAAITGDVTATANSFATTIAANAVTFAKFQQVAASSLVGNAAGSLANVTGITLAGGLAFSGSTLTAAGALTPTSVASTGAVSGTTISGSTSILSSGTGGVGYKTGAGGAVTQITSRTTGVTLNTPCGAITLVSAAGSATWSTFTVTNSAVVATDTIEIAQKSGANLYNAIVTAVGAGSFNISVSAVSGTATESPVLNFVVVKAVAA